MKIIELVAVLERAAVHACSAGRDDAAMAAVCHASGGVEDLARAGDKLAMRAFAALAKIAGHPEWVGEDGRPCC